MTPRKEVRPEAPSRAHKRTTILSAKVRPLDKPVALAQGSCAFVRKV